MVGVTDVGVESYIRYHLPNSNKTREQPSPSEQADGQLFDHITDYTFDHSLRDIWLTSLSADFLSLLHNICEACFTWTVFESRHIWLTSLSADFLSLLHNICEACFTWTVFESRPNRDFRCSGLSNSRCRFLFPICPTSEV